MTLRRLQTSEFVIIDERSVFDCWCTHPDHPERKLWIGCLVSEKAARDLMTAHLEQKHGLDPEAEREATDGHSDREVAARTPARPDDAIGAET